MFIIWNYDTPSTFFFSCIWNLCEYFKISLGRFAHIVFELTIGKKEGKK